MLEKNTADEAIVLVPGLFLSGWSMGALRARLAACGFEPKAFSYHTVRAGLRESAAELARFLYSVPHPVVHFVGHSLGGLLIRHLFALYPEQRPGRVVTLGTPHQGSYVARKLARLPALRAVLALPSQDGLSGNAPAWPAARELGVIAGALPFGVGRLVTGLPTPNDGTVGLEETRLPGMSAHIAVPVTHTGLLVSSEVAKLICRYLRTGRF